MFSFFFFVWGGGGSITEALILVEVVGKGHLFQGNRRTEEQLANFEGDRGTKTQGQYFPGIISKHIFDNMETS